MKTDEQKLFELVDSIGEVLTGDIHIIDNTEKHPVEGELEYRVYHSNGYCFDVSKRADNIDEETGDVKSYYYDFYEEWEGFDKIKEAKDAIKLIKTSTKKQSA